MSFPRLRSFLTFRMLYLSNALPRKEPGDPFPSITEAIAGADKKSMA